MDTNQTKQPRALLRLAATEMWERFGFYMIQAVLVLMMTNHFHLSDSLSLLITGTYGALIYIAPVIGGYYADKILGYRYTILMGCALQLLGYLLIATLHLPTVLLGLSVIVLGNGFLKGNIPSFLGKFYRQNDDRRSAGFTLYYVGMNVGSFLSITFVGYIQEGLGWYYCYIFAAIGMFIGIATYLSGFRCYAQHGLPVNKELLYKRTLRFITITVLLSIALVAASYLLLSHAGYGDILLSLFGLVILAYLIWLAIFKFQGYERKHLLALIALTLFAIVFWALFFQCFSLIPLFIERTVNHHVFGSIVPTSSFLGLEPVFIFVLGWPLAALWKRLHHLKKDPNIILKFVLALLSISLGMKFIAILTEHPGLDGLIAPAMMIILFFLITLGEMLLSPNFLAAVTELSPKHIVGMMMGVQYIAIGFGSLLAGVLAQTGAMPKNVGALSPHLVLATYRHAFNVNAATGLITAVITLILMPAVAKLMRAGDKTANPTN